MAGLAGLLILAVLAQGPIRVLQQLFDLVGHARLVQKSSRRLWRAGRMVAIAIGFTVLAWTASQAWIFNQESRKADLISLTKSRRLSELALEQGLFASLTPLRDVAGLADNLPLLVIAAIVVFRSSFEIPGWGVPSPGTGTISTQARTRAGWSTLIWGCGSLYALYRIVARMAGSTDLPLGSCLVVEGLIVPLLMVVCDGFLLAWMVVELRNAGFDDTGEDRLDARQAIALMPAAALVSRLRPAGPIHSDLGIAGFVIPAHIGQRHISGQLCPLATRLGIDRRSGGGTHRVWPGRRGRLEPGIDSRGDRRIRAALGVRGWPCRRGGGDRRVRLGIAGGGRVRCRIIVAGAKLGPGRGRQLRPLRHAAGRALDPGRLDRAS